MGVRRRDVLAGGLALAQVVASRRVLAQTAPATRAAVVIGVNKTGGNLPVLRAAVSGAKSVSDWLKGEGFEVELITDENGQPVTAEAVKKAVFKFVDRNRIAQQLTQLVIYFSGHGVAFGSTELWLLTGAPEEADEAISVLTSWELAHYSRIPNVILISDACRSIPTYNASRITGTPIFPNRQLPPGMDEAAVDRFLATEPGAPSFEAQFAADNYEGVYTSLFLDAFSNPRTGMVEPIDGKNVIPNVKLRPFLKDQVPRRLERIDPQHTQYPFARLESRDNNYIGRALRPATDLVASAARQTTVFDVANHRLNTTIKGGLGSFVTIDQQALEKVASESGFDAAQKSVREAKHPLSFETNTGLAVNGARVRAVKTAVESDAEVLSPGRPDAPALIRILANTRPLTVGLMFEDGSGTVVAALPGFIGTINVENGLVTSMTYLPSRNGPRWSDYDADGKRLDELRSVVATSARYGSFRIEGNKEERSAAARRIGDQIRVLKGIDPTLGIYAAYAYADANLTEQVRSVQSFMRSDLGADLFDVALLAGTIPRGRIGAADSVVPICPMLTQGWQWLDVRQVSLPESVQRARGDLRDSLWTTFGPRGMDSMFSAIQSTRRPNAG